MSLLDHHMHSDISFDSIEKIENYLNKTNNIIITTEHLDFNDPSSGYLDLIPDYDAQYKEVNRLNKLYNNRVYLGIEIGWTKSSHDKIKAFLENKNYDLKVLSVHQNGRADYLEKEKFYGISAEEIIIEYLTLMLEAVDAMGKEVDVLAHFDYGFRVHNISVDDLDKYGKELFQKLCDSIIDYEICFELNTSSMYRHNNLKLYDWAVPIYQRRGGNLFVLGSDAHNSEDYKYEFDKLSSFFKKHKIKEVQNLFGTKKGAVKLKGLYFN